MFSPVVAALQRRGDKQTSTTISETVVAGKTAQKTIKRKRSTLQTFFVMELQGGLQPASSSAQPLQAVHENETAGTQQPSAKIKNMLDYNRVGELECHVQSDDDNDDVSSISSSSSSSRSSPTRRAVKKVKARKEHVEKSKPTRKVTWRFDRWMTDGTLKQMQCKSNNNKHWLLLLPQQQKKSSISTASVSGTDVRMGDPQQHGVVEERFYDQENLSTTKTEHVNIGQIIPGASPSEIAPQYPQEDASRSKFISYDMHEVLRQQILTEWLDAQDGEQARTDEGNDNDNPRLKITCYSRNDKVQMLRKQRNPAKTVSSSSLSPTNTACFEAVGVVEESYFFKSKPQRIRIVSTGSK